MVKGCMALLLQCFVHDKNGKLISKTRKRISKSFVKQWMQILEAFMANVGGDGSDPVIVKDTSNAGQSIDSSVLSNYVLATEAPVNNANYGLLVGTGVTPPATADYALETKIAHGVGAGQLQHGATSVQSAGIVGVNMDMVMTRAFVNGSGGTIVAKEIGIVVNSSASSWYFLIAHDAIDVIVLDGQTLTVQYTMRTTV